MNKYQCIGNLTSDPELKYLDSGTTICTFTVATNERWTDKTGEKKELTEFTRCTAFGKQGETISKYFTKGKPIYVECKKQTRSYERDGQKRYVTDFVVQNFEFVPADKTAKREPDRDQGYPEPPVVSDDNDPIPF